jgi:hypothetical protein
MMEIQEKILEMVQPNQELKITILRVPIGLAFMGVMVAVHKVLVLHWV